MRIVWADLPEAAVVVPGADLAVLDPGTDPAHAYCMLRACGLTGDAALAIVDQLEALLRDRPLLA